MLDTPAEAREIGGTEALLALAVQDLDVVVLDGQFVRELAGAVGAVVVGHEHVRRRDRLADPADDALDVLRLVVGRNDHQRRAERPELPLPVLCPEGPVAVVHCCPFMSVEVHHSGRGLRRRDRTFVWWVSIPQERGKHGFAVSGRRRTPPADGGPAPFGPTWDPLAAGRPKAVVY